jgi:putative DNA primase/helicase
MLTRHSLIEVAVEFLKSLPADGAPAKDVRRQAQGAGLSWATVRRAKAKLGLKAEREGGFGGAGRWIWRLPSASITRQSAAPKGLEDF